MDLTAPLSKPYSEMSAEEQAEVQAADREALRDLLRHVHEEIRENPDGKFARAKRAQDAALRRAEDEYRARGYNQI